MDQLSDRTRATPAPLLAGVPVVDADTHLSEWYDLWTSRAPSRFKDRVPQVREINDDMSGSSTASC